MDDSLCLDGCSLYQSSGGCYSCIWSAYRVSVQSDWKEIPNTRLNDVNGTMTFTGGDKIQILGLHTSPSGEVKKFMYDGDYPNNGQIVTYDDKSNSWNYTPKRFWPKEGKLEFMPVIHRTLFPITQIIVR